MFGSEILLAFLVDLCLGDPVWPWHPVRLMGRMVSLGENLVRFYLPSALLLGGALLAVLLPFMVWDASYLLLQGVRQFQIYHLPQLNLAYLAGSALIYFCLSVRDLGEHAMAVVCALEKEDLSEARQAVSKMVGRDTLQMDANAVMRACLESVAESTCDGVIGPLFYACLGGAPLALAYKMVSTLDSMVGYKNPRYELLGKASARLDDVLNWVPARLSVLLVSLAAWVLGLAPARALTTAWQDGRYHPSPNAGWPEAAFAGALEVQLGGPSSYQGVVVEKGYLGVPRKALDLEQLRWGVVLMYATASLAVTGIVCFWILVHLGIL